MRLRLVVAVALAGASLVIASVVAQHQDTPATSTSPVPVDAVELPTSAAPLAPVARGHNAAVTSRVADKLMDRVPLPPGATARDAAPSRAVRYRDRMLTTERSLWRWGWWVVPMSYPDLERWYRVHTGAHVEDPYRSRSDFAKERGELAWLTGDDARSHAQPEVVVSYATLADGLTAIRVDVLVAARFDRTAATLVPAGQVRSAEVTSTTDDGPARIVTDPQQVQTLARSFDAVVGDVDDQGTGACGWPRQDLRSYAVTFRWPGHVLDVDEGSPLCGGGRVLELDGVRLPERLDETDEPFNHALRLLFVS